MTDMRWHGTMKWVQYLNIGTEKQQFSQPDKCFMDMCIFVSHYSVYACCTSTACVLHTYAHVSTHARAVYLLLELTEQWLKVGLSLLVRSAG